MGVKRKLTCCQQMIKMSKICNAQIWQGVNSHLLFIWIVAHDPGLNSLNSLFLSFVRLDSGLRILYSGVWRPEHWFFSLECGYWSLASWPWILDSRLSMAVRPPVRLPAARSYTPGNFQGTRIAFREWINPLLPTCQQKHLTVWFQPRAPGFH